MKAINLEKIEAVMYKSAMALFVVGMVAAFAVFSSPAQSIAKQVAVAQSSAFEAAQPKEFGWSCMTAGSSLPMLTEEPIEGRTCWKI